jgi:hypothetical protein
MAGLSIPKDPVFAVLAAAFAVIAVGDAYYLVRGFRHGLIGRRYVPLRMLTPWPDGRSRFYYYRDLEPSDFWETMAFQAFAVAMCVFMVFFVMTLPR